MDRLLTPDEVCNYLQIPKSKLYTLTSMNSIPVYRIGRILRFRESDLIEWLQKDQNEKKNRSMNSS